MLASDFIVERLIELGVRHVFGVGGANIEDMFSAVQRRRPQIQAVLGKHEHAAGTAADAYGRIRGLGVVMTTSGGGAMNLVHAMAEARASNVRVLAIVGEPPTNLQGRGAFQDTSGKGDAVDARAVFQAATSRCARVQNVEELPRLLGDAIDAVLDTSGPAVLLVAKDIQRSYLHADGRLEMRSIAAHHGAPNADDVRRAASWLDARPAVIIAGSEVARTSSQKALFSLVEALDARVATTPDGRDAFDNRHPRFLGVSGAMGHPAALRAFAEARLIIAVGTRLPMLAREGLVELLGSKKLLSVGQARPFASAAENLHLDGDISAALHALTAACSEVGRESIDAPAPLNEAAAPTDASPLSSAAILAAVDRAAPDGSVVLVDAGNTGASAIHHLRAPRRGRWLIAMGMAGMGYTFGAATGAAFATGKRCIVVAGDGAFFMHGLEIHTAVEHRLPITYVILNNRAHGMCLVRERLLLGENAGYNAFRPSHIGAGLAAMFPGLSASDCATEGELARLLARSMTEEGPSVICAELGEVEVPPFSLFQDRAPLLATVARETHHG